MNNAIIRCEEVWLMLGIFVRSSLTRPAGFFFFVCVCMCDLKGKKIYMKIYNTSLIIRRIMASVVKTKFFSSQSPNFTFFPYAYYFAAVAHIMNSGDLIFFGLQQATCRSKCTKKILDHFHSRPHNPVQVTLL